MDKTNYINIRKRYARYKKFLIFTSIGTIIILVGLFGGIIKKFFTDSETVADYIDKEIVSSAEDEYGNNYYHVTFYYKVDEKIYEYTPKTLISEEAFEGENIIYYKKCNPNFCVSKYETQIDAISIFALLFMISFPIIGVIGLIYEKNSRNMVEE